MAKIYLVAGHGGSDAGACDYGRKEKDDVLRLTLDVGAELKRLGHTVMYNRTSDVDTDMYAYTRACNNFGADFCLSIHRNAFYRKAKGYETCIYSNTGKSKLFADYVNAGMASIGFTNRGSKIRTDLYVLNSTTMPAALIEVGFIDSEEDNRIFTSRYSDIVKCIVNGVLKAVGSSQSAGNVTPSKPTEPAKTPAKKDLGKVNCYYQVFTNRWWPTVKNYEDWAGEGDGVPIRYLGICVDKGSIRARVHTLGGRWLPSITFGDAYNIGDLINGVVGDGNPIDAIELYYITPEGYEYKKAVYCASSLEGDEFYPVQYDDEVSDTMDGYAGAMGIAIDKFKAWIE